MRLLVTGGLGFIGANFVRSVLDDAEVTVVDALKYGSNESNLKGLDYCLVKGDICDYALMAQLVKDTDAIVNFAAETHVDRSIASPLSFVESNVIGVFTILEAMRKVNPETRLIHVGTDEVYGDIETGSFSETDTLTPSSPYSASKAAADMFVLAYARTYGLDTVITRCTNNYGPYQFPEKLVPKSIIRAAMNLKLPIYGAGENVRDWIFVTDHGAAIRFVLEKGERGEIYNIAGGEERTNFEVVTEILSLLDKPNLIEFVEDRPGHDLRYSLDSSKLQKLGWRPRHNFKAGLRETVAWYVENEWWWAPLIDDRVLHPTPWKLEW